MSPINLLLCLVTFNFHWLSLSINFLATSSSFLAKMLSWESNPGCWVWSKITIQYPLCYAPPPSSWQFVNETELRLFSKGGKTNYVNKNTFLVLFLAEFFPIRCFLTSWESHWLSLNTYTLTLILSHTHTYTSNSLTLSRTRTRLSCLLCDVNQHHFVTEVVYSSFFLPNGNSLSHLFPWKHFSSGKQFFGQGVFFTKFHSLVLVEYLVSWASSVALACASM